MLLRQALVRRQEDDAVQIAIVTVLGQIMAVLQDIDVHQQGLAAPRCVPECQLAEIGGLVGINPVSLGLVGVEFGDVAVQVSQQLVGVSKETVKINRKFGWLIQEIFMMLPIVDYGKTENIMSIGRVRI